MMLQLGKQNRGNTTLDLEWRRMHVADLDIRIKEISGHGQIFNVLHRIVQNWKIPENA
jgi:hypothetical protein